MRTIKELLCVVRENKKVFRLGLCHWVGVLFMVKVITESEYKCVMRYLEDNLPKMKYKRAYCWKMGNIKPRLKWLDEHIEINS